MAKDTVNQVTVLLSDAEAMALAQFVKRSTYDTYSERAVDQRETDLMLSAVAHLADGLRHAGFNPR